MILLKRKMVSVLTKTPVLVLIRIVSDEHITTYLHT